MTRPTQRSNACAAILLGALAASSAVASPASVAPEVSETPATLPTTSQSHRGLVPAQDDGLVVCGDPADGGTCGGDAKQDAPRVDADQGPSDGEDSDDQG